MPSGSYTAPTLQQAINALAARLDDPSQIHWVGTELGLYVIEALRTWGALTATFRNTGVFQTQNAEPFYDLAVQLPALRAYTVRDQDLVSQLEYHLLEPQSTGAVWGGSEQFSLSDLTDALARRRDQFLRETGAVVTRTKLPVSPSPNGRVALPEVTAVLRRVAWVDPIGIVTPLNRDDEWAVDAFAPKWVQQPGRPPIAYSVGVTTPLYVQLAPAPVDTGVLDVVSINAGAVIDLTNPTPLGVPDDWTWVVKFGALADLLSRDGLALDPARAAYCESRWQDGLTLARLASTVLTARVNNAVCDVGSLSDADVFWPTWQTVPGLARAVLCAGQNLVAIAPPPGVLVNGAPYAITLDVVSNTPVPKVSITPLPIGSETLDVVLDYAQHLALVKEGPTELEQAQPFLERFYRAAGVDIKIRKASSPNRSASLEQTTQDQRAVPLQVEA